jgi:hypothetical protein
MAHIMCSSTVIHHLQDECRSNPYKALAYFYISYEDTRTQNRVNMMKSMVKQLASCRPDMPQSLENIRRFHDDLVEPSLKDLESALWATSQDFSDVFLVIDALDECPEDGAKNQGERGNLLKLIRDIRGWGQPSLHLFLTSRDKYDVNTGLQPLSPLILDLAEHKTRVEMDMEVFIETILEPKPWPRERKDRVRDTLIQKSEGMYVCSLRFSVRKPELTIVDRFQYVQLHVAALQRAYNPAGAEAALRDLPIGLADTYTRALSGISLERREIAIRALNWVCFCPYNLDVDTLSELVIVEIPPEAKSCSSSWATASDFLKKWIPLLQERKFYQPKEVLDLLPPGLVIVDHGSIRLSHFSVKEFLVTEDIKKTGAAQFSLSEREGQILMAESSLLYLIYLSDTNQGPGFFAPKICHVGLGIADSLQDWPVFLRRLLRAVLDPAGKPFVLLARGIQYIHEKGTELASPIYYTISEGLSRLSSFVLEERICDANALGGGKITALNLACQMRNLSAVSLLLKTGAGRYPPAGVTAECSPLSCAVPDIPCLRKLLEAPSLLSQCERAGFSPIVDGCRREDFELIRFFLLEYGADVNASDASGVTPLRFALEHRWPDRGAFKTTTLLIENGANVNEKVDGFGNLLQYTAATCMSELAATKLLLIKGAMVDPPGEEWDSLLYGLYTKYLAQEQGLLYAARLRDLQGVFGTRSRSHHLTEEDVDKDMVYYSDLVEWRQIVREERRSGRSGGFTPPWKTHGRPEPDWESEYRW